MTAAPVTVRGLRPDADVDACETILRSLPEWFGLEDANRAFVASLRTLPAAVATTSGRIEGFVALTEHSSDSHEIHVMAVRRELHSVGIGTALLSWAQSRCRDRGVAYLHVKTLGPSTPDAAYETTRRFYLARGFVPLFETTALWGPDNAALVLVQHVACVP